VKKNERSDKRKTASISKKKEDRRIAEKDAQDVSYRAKKEALKKERRTGGKEDKRSTRGLFKYRKKTAREVTKQKLQGRKKTSGKKRYGAQKSE